MSTAAALPTSAFAELRDMKRGWSWPVLGLAAVLSLVAHGGLLTTFLSAPDEIQMDGGAPATVAALGNAFQDYTRGALPSRPDLAAPVEAETPPPPPSATAIPTSQQTAQPSAPTSSPSPPHLPETSPTAATQPTSGLEARPEPPQAPPASSPGTIALSRPAQPALAAESPEMTTSAAQPMQSAPLALPPLVPPVTPEVTPAPPEVEVQTAEADTPRPQRRPDLQDRQRQAQQAEEARQASPAQVAGDSDRNARRGTDRGQEQATAAAAAERQTQTQAQAQANAAASNYPGQVMRQIQRQRRPRVNTRGAAVVSFTVASGGGLASARLAQSSGNQDLDRAAVALVQHAAPFPPPPPGAERNFAVQIIGR